jgi:hypothetical protein
MISTILVTRSSLKTCKSPIRVSQAGDACLVLIIINFIVKKAKSWLSFQEKFTKQDQIDHIEVSVLTHTLGSNYGFN